MWLFKCKNFPWWRHHHFMTSSSWSIFRFFVIFPFCIKCHAYNFKDRATNNTKIWSQLTIKYGTQVWWLRRLKLFFLKSILFFMWNPFYFKVIPILFSCHIHFIFMSYSFYFQVIFILFSCHSHFKKFKKNFKIEKLFHIDLKKMNMTSVIAHEAHTKSFHIDSKTKCIWHRLNFFRLEPFEPRPFHFILKCIWHGRGSKGSGYC